MQRTQAEGNDGGRYTEGNPGLGVPATVVGALELNLIQEEICNVVEDAGITLDDAEEAQLLDAVKAIVGRGGDKVTAAIADNQVAAANLTGVIFDKTLIKSVRFLLDVMRRNDTQNATEVFDCFAILNEETDTWSLSFTGRGDESGIGLSVDSATGQVKYTSTSYAGTNYAGTWRVTAITKVLI